MNEQFRCTVHVDRERFPRRGALLR
ncbi:MAG: hypothetical protein QOK47_1136, partial [Actinomycetota bacterium]|nr:hypothetical protein [Actinomycetota bacterium]